MSVCNYLTLSLYIVWNTNTLFYYLFILIQVTVWDFNRYGPNDFLGEVLLDLDNIMMNHEPNWYTLKPHEEIASFSVSVFG